ncbi:MAG: galactokinase [Verrucomicrobiota bacterium]
MSTTWLEVKVPGRVELLGNHTDYNQGLVISMAVDRYTIMRSRLREDHILRLRSLNLEETWQGSLNNLVPQKEQHWVNYVVGVLAALKEREVEILGMDMEIESSIPLGFGLSSSAALEVASLLTCKQYHSLDQEPLEMAKMCQWAENQFAGVSCGLMDQISVLISQRGSVNKIDLQSLGYENLPFSKAFCFLVVDSETRHQLVDGEYSNRREVCESAAKKLDVAYLREVQVDHLDDRKFDLSLEEHKRALHVVTENERVQKACQALQEGAMERLGQLMFESHESSKNNFENSCRELDELVDFASRHKACLGARLTGGGFGGAVVHLLERSKKDFYQNDLTSFFSKKFGRPPKIIEVNPVAGALNI